MDTMTDTTTRHQAEEMIQAEHKWRTWPDWVNLAIAVYVLLAPLWTQGATWGWFATMGVLIGAGAIWALATASSQASEWTTLILGAVLFLAPWIGGFASAAAAAWTAWIAGVAVIIFAVIGMQKNRNAVERY